jgi:hypothetical protein
MMPHCGEKGPYDDHNSKTKKRERDLGKIPILKF